MFGFVSKKSIEEAELRATRDRHQCRMAEDALAIVREDLRDVQRELAVFKTTEKEAREFILRVPVGEDRMDKEQLLAAFDVPEDHALWLAVLQVIDDELLEGSEDLMQPPSQAMTTEVRTHKAGGCEALRALQGVLVKLRNNARVSRKDAAKKESEND